MDQIKVSKLNEYGEYAMRTARQDISNKQMRDHALWGLAGEVGELHSIFQKDIQGHGISQEAIRKEAGDILWMLNEFCWSQNLTLEDIANENLNKLAKRYPEGFSADRSLHRKEGDI